MNFHALKIRKIDLFEKRYLASRISCVVFILLLTSYTIGGEFSTIDRFVLVGIFILLIQFIFQFSWINLSLGLMMFSAGAYFSLPVLSEFLDFPVSNHDAYLLLIVGHW